MAKDWDALTTDQTRVAINAVIDHIVVGSATPGHNWYEPTRLEIQWADLI